VNIRAGAAKLQRRVAALVRRFDPIGGDTPSPPALDPGGSLAKVHETRELVAATYLRGEGIEIGALHQPLRVPASTRVKYVDRMTAADLRRQYEELAGFTLVETDIIDDGERLTTIGNETQDFVIANHFIEHCQNPILTFQNLLRVMRPGGVLYLAVPDKRFTFDIDRPCTTVEHLMRDFTEGPEWSRRQHFEEWTRLVNKNTDEAQITAEVTHLMDIDYSIHFHVWTANELLELVTTVCRIVPFELELFLRSGFETLLILRKPSTA
jgi:SAM-dependent methyltransferase